MNTNPALIIEDALGLDSGLIIQNVSYKETPEGIEIFGNITCPERRYSFPAAEPDITADFITPEGTVAYSVTSNHDNRFWFNRKTTFRILVDTAVYRKLTISEIHLYLVFR